MVSACLWWSLGSPLPGWSFPGWSFPGHNFLGPLHLGAYSPGHEALLAGAPRWSGTKGCWPAPWAHCSGRPASRRYWDTAVCLAGLDRPLTSLGRPLRPRLRRVRSCRRCRGLRGRLRLVLAGRVPAFPRSFGTRPCCSSVRCGIVVRISGRGCSSWRGILGLRRGSPWPICLRGNLATCCAVDEGGDGRFTVDVTQGEFEVLEVAVVPASAYESLRGAVSFSLPLASGSPIFYRRAAHPVDPKARPC